MQLSQLKFRKIFFVSLFSVFALSNASAVNAQDDNSGPFFGKNAPGKWTIGLKAASIDPNIEGISDADAAGVVLGYEFATSIGPWGGSSSIEIEYLQSDTEQFFVGSGTSYDAESLGIFYTYRSPGQVYFKVKGGLVTNTLQVNSVITSERRDLESTNIALGLGLGVRITDRALIELEYLQEAGSNDLEAGSDSDFLFAQQDGGTDLGIISLNGMYQF